MAKLTKQERETVITFNQGEKTAAVFTYDVRIMAKMKENGIKATEKNEFGACTYVLPNKKAIQIRFRAARELTDEEKEEIRERLAAGKAAKNKAAKKAAPKPAAKPAPAKKAAKPAVVEDKEEPEPAPKAKGKAKPKADADEDIPEEADDLLDDKDDVPVKKTGKAKK